MTTALEELTAANAGKGTLGKAADDEPVFILRAQDEFAPEIVERWALRLETVAGRTPKVREARALAHKMRAWQEMNGAKVPD